MHAPDVILPSWLCLGHEVPHLLDSFALSLGMLKVAITIWTFLSGTNLISATLLLLTFTTIHCFTRVVAELRFFIVHLDLCRLLVLHKSAIILVKGLIIFLWSLTRLILLLLEINSTTSNSVMLTNRSSIVTFSLVHNFAMILAISWIINVGG